MADYFPVLSRAVAGLENNTGETRRAVYDRARAAIVRQLRSIDPPLPEEQITQEQKQLEEAIGRVEAEAEPGAPAKQAPAKPTPAKPVTAAQPQRPVRSAAPAQLPAAPPAAPKQARPDPVDALTEEDAPATASGSGDATRPAEAADGARPRQGPARRADGRPILRAADDAGAGGKRKRSVPMVALIALAAVGLGAGLYLARGSSTGPVSGNKDAEVARKEAPMSEPAPAPPAVGKSDDRVGVSPAPAESPAGPTPPAETSPAPESEVARAPDADPGVQPAPPAVAPETPPEPPPAAPAETAQTSTTALVAQRATLYEEGANQQSGEALNGAVVWRVESVAGGQNRPLETALRGDVDIPGRNVKATLLIRRNADATLPASHTIELQFKLPDDFPNAGISNVPGILMKADESGRGATVSGLSVRVTNGFFLIGLSNLDSERSVNEQLLRDRGWIDVPILYDNGRRAVLTLEKGTPGSQAFNEAFAAWQSASAGGGSPPPQP